VSDIKIGDALRTTDFSGALAAYNEAITVSRTLVTVDRSNMRWQEDLARALISLGNVLQARGDLDGAQKNFREGLDLYRALTSKDPNNAVWQVHLVVTLVQLSLLGDEPRTRFKEALGILKDLQSQGRLPPAQLNWISMIEAELTKLGQAGSR
jgi:tetratricopeptide (TPR) repeat protein